MVVLENALIKASIDPRGAELKSLLYKENNVEYIWNGDPKYWARHSPVLFPIVGSLKNDSFIYEGKKYTLKRHGFARDMIFEKEAVFGDSASFVLKSSAETLEIYPFKFLLRIKYQLNGNSIRVDYEVENPGNKALYFSIGSHPAFNVPLVKGTSYEDYYLDFSEEENAERWTISDNLITGTVPFLQDQKKLQLKASLFENDALVFKGLKSNRISICSDKTIHGLHYDFRGFPYLGIWAAKDAPFVCIEPWFGIADSESHNQNIEQKEGIIKLDQGHKWDAGWSLTCV
ncbi:aldose 1-epimerase family protein [Desertivirga xinjiangensis]|uniref:aldose 1-epimerase family protein n=1 Tax=Desertivirga xinjiangensis TaxID=539206 RepID=UPI0021086654|nr:aldose 1-epimerase family protein [Pedobacter xinjiangensis]